MRKLLPTCAGRRSRLGIVAAAAAALTLTSLAPASAHHAPKSHRFTITTKTIDGTQVDAGAPGASLGDSNVITEDVIRDGKKVGPSDLTTRSGASRSSRRSPAAPAPTAAHAAS